MDWTRGYSVTAWRLYEVDPRTWADGAEIAGVTSATVERSCSKSDAAPPIESGSVELSVPVGSDFGERVVRLAMVAEQDGVAERVDVATMLAAGVGGSVERGMDALELDCRSVLWPAAVREVPCGSSCPAGVDAPTWAAEALSEAVPAPVAWEGGFALDEPYVFDPHETVLGAAWRVLRAGGWTISIDGHGEVRVGPVPTEPALLLDQAGARLLMPDVAHELDWTGVPNRYRATDGLLYAEAVNDDPTSPTSTASRGYVHDGDGLDESPVRVGGESLAEYCARRLEEESVALDVRGYDRKYWPGVVPGSLVRGTLPTAGIEGDLRVQRQTLSCGAGLFVSEEAAREVAAWTRS